MKKNLLMAFLLLLTGCNSNNNQISESVDTREVAHVVFLLGQSNAEGVSFNYCLDNNLKTDEGKEVTDTTYQDFKDGFENIMINFQCDGILNASNGFTTVKLGQGLTSTRFGPEVGIADYISKNHEGKVYIIKNAYGGTSIYKDWATKSITHGTTGFCYDSFLAQKNECIDYFNRNNMRMEVEAICFMQGEEDSVHEEYAKIYGNYLSLFVKDIREELAEYARDGGIGFIDGAIGPVWERAGIINGFKKGFAASSSLNHYIETGETYSYTKEPEEQPDLAHLDSLDMLKLGHEFGKILCEYYL